MGIDIAIVVRYDEEAMSELVEAKLAEASEREGLLLARVPTCG